MRGMLLAAATTMLIPLAVFGQMTEDDVLLKIEVESWGEPTGMSPVAHGEASGGTAMALSSNASAVGGLRLQAGDYTLLFWAHAPAGNQDAFFVEIDGERTRLKGPIGEWGTVALPFSVDRAGPVVIAIIGQEAGMTLDRMAVVRGTHEQGSIQFASVPGETAGASIALDEIPRLAAPCSLAQVPDAPFELDETTVYHETFDTPCTGAVGEHRWVAGRFGQALALDMPDGRFDVDLSRLELGSKGTIEWWAKPREAARIWWDQGWHYFLHAEPAEEGGTQLDLARHPMTQLRLLATLDGEPYTIDKGTHEVIPMTTSHLSVEDWHHMLVSWDFTGDPQYLWLMIDGEGMQMFFPATFEGADFSRIELCNTPSDWEIPYLPMDGAIDELRISNQSVADRLAK